MHYSIYRAGKPEPEDEEVYPPSYTCEGEAIQENSDGSRMARLGDAFQKQQQIPSGMTTRETTAKAA
jgi:hypothetical protein